MKQWMTRKLVIPRWVLLAIASLSIVSFSVLYAKAHELHNESHTTEIELLRARNPGILCIWTLDIPIIGTLGFPEMWIGFLCNLGIVAGAVCTLVRGRRTTQETDPVSGSHEE